jgi:hypothetical protein
VQLIALTDEAPGDVQAFVRDHGIEYIVGAGSRTDQAYGVSFLPTAAVIDQAGHWVWVGHPDEGLDNVVQQMIRKP